MAALTCSFISAAILAFAGIVSALPRFRCHHQAFRAGSCVGHAKGRHAALADARNARHDLLDLVGVQVTARLEDDLLGSPGDKNLAVGAIGAVAGGQPSGRPSPGETDREWRPRC